MSPPSTWKIKEQPRSKVQRPDALQELPPAPAEQAAEPNAAMEGHPGGRGIPPSQGVQACNKCPKKHSQVQNLLHASPTLEAWQGCCPQGQCLCPREAGDIAPFLREEDVEKRAQVRCACSGPAAPPRRSPGMVLVPGQGHGGRASRLWEPRFFFLKAGNAAKKKTKPHQTTLHHLTQQFHKVRAAINLSITGLGLVRCPRL